jgi:alpha-tubulin suppressor-like RCC1 family protein
VNTPDDVVDGSHAMDVASPSDIVDVSLPDVADVVTTPDLVTPADRGAPECVTDGTRSCYTGAPASRGVGACRDGVERCVSGRWSGVCTGQVVPTSERCGNRVDENCNGTVDDGCTPTTIAAPRMGLGNVTTCVLNEAGEAWCWGGNSNGAIGDVVTGTARAPLRAPSFDGLSLAAIDHRTCVVRNDRTVQCVGTNTYGQLGNGSTVDSRTLVVVTGLTAVTALSLGLGHSCAVSAGQVRCWGDNSSAQLGATTTATCGTMRAACSSVPLAVAGLSGVTGVALGSSHSCALLATGTVWCWGSNNQGQLGVNPVGLPSSRTPVMVTGLTGVTQIVAGVGHTCALSSGVVRCWGGNTFGILGDSGAARFSPTTIPVSNAVQLASTVHHACARLADGSLRCWGYDAYGQTGSGVMRPSTPVPVRPPGLPSAVDLQTGYWHTCMRSATRTTWCWGWNIQGQIGNGLPTTNQFVPIVVLR